MFDCMSLSVAEIECMSKLQEAEVNIFVKKISRTKARLSRWRNSYYASLYTPGSATKNDKTGMFSFRESRVIFSYWSVSRHNIEIQFCLLVLYTRRA